MSDTNRLKRLGAEIRAARDARGLRLRHVAQALGLKLRTLHAWEQGENHIPTLRLLELADFVGLDLARVGRKRVLREASRRA